MVTNAYGIWRGLQQVSYDNDQYRAVVKNEVREPIFISTKVQSMHEAIRETDALAKHWRAHNGR